MIILYTRKPRGYPSLCSVLLYFYFRTVRLPFKNITRLYALTHKDCRLVVYIISEITHNIHNLLYVNYSLTSKLTCNRERIMYYVLVLYLVLL